MNATVFLRLAAIILFLHLLGHTAGAMLSGPQHGPTEVAVLEAMRASKFDFMGTMRSYWEFYYGFSVIINVVLVCNVVLLWQLSSLARTAPQFVREITPILFLEWAGAAVADWFYFFAAPLSMATGAAVCIAIAYWFLRRQ